MASSTKSKKPVSFDEYFKECDPELQKVAAGVRALVKKAVPKVAETINPWGLPTFESNGPMCYVMIGKKHVTFGFSRGTALDDPEELLEGTGKNLRHVKLRSLEDVNSKGLRGLIVSAAKLNKAEPVVGMRMKKN